MRGLVGVVQVHIMRARSVDRCPMSFFGRVFYFPKPPSRTHIWHMMDDMCEVGYIYIYMYMCIMRKCYSEEGGVQIAGQLAICACYKSAPRVKRWACRVARFVELGELKCGGTLVRMPSKPKYGIYGNLLMCT